MALSVLLVLGLVATELPLFHAHAEETPGWYDQECPLERLATGSPGLAAQPELATVRVPVTAQTVVRPAPILQHPHPRPFAARAPPPLA
jgi:hypothetical protein